MIYTYSAAANGSQSDAPPWTPASRLTLAFQKATESGARHGGNLSEAWSLEPFPSSGAAERRLQRLRKHACLPLEGYHTGSRSRNDWTCPPYPDVQHTDRLRSVENLSYVQQPGVISSRFGSAAQQQHWSYVAVLVDATNCAVSGDDCADVDTDLHLKCHTSTVSDVSRRRRSEAAAALSEHWLSEIRGS